MAKRRKKELDTPRKVRTTVEELEVLARLKETVEWAIFKRLTNRYIHNLMRISFKLVEGDPNFSSRHAELAGRALGLKIIIRIVERAGRKLEELEKKK